jgi:hypothetical protein
LLALFASLVEWLVVSSGGNNERGNLNLSAVLLNSKQQILVGNLLAFLQAFDHLQTQSALAI